MNPLIATMRRELRRLVSRKAYIFAFFVVPLGCTIFFLSLMSQGLPLHVPTAIVDQDHSAMSREITRTLNANSLVTITRAEQTYSDAVAAVRRGQVYGFFVIPKDFEADAVAGRTPVIDYYSNMTYYVPGTFLFKGFKTTSVTSAAGMMRASLTASGMEDDRAMNIVQPMTIETHAPGNPWTNYSMYLTPSFMMTMLSLMILLVTAFSITEEIKWRTSPRWLETAGGSITTLVGYRNTPLFRLDEVNVSDTLTVDCPPRGSGIYVLEGAGTLSANGRSLPLKKTDQLFVPAGTGRFTLDAEAPLRVLHFFGPEQKK